MDTEVGTVAHAYRFSTCKFKEGWSIQGQFELHNKTLY